MTGTRRGGEDMEVGFMIGRERPWIGRFLVVSSRYPFMAFNFSERSFRSQQAHTGA